MQYNLDLRDCMYSMHSSTFIKYTLNVSGCITVYIMFHSTPVGCYSDWSHI